MQVQSSVVPASVRVIYISKRMMNRGRKRKALTQEITQLQHSLEAKDEEVQELEQQLRDARRERSNLQACRDTSRREQVHASRKASMTPFCGNSGNPCFGVASNNLFTRLPCIARAKTICPCPCLPKIACACIHVAVH